MLALDERFIVLAPIGRDGQLICTQLQRNHLSSVLVAGPADALELAQRGAAGLIVTEEAIQHRALADWQAFVRSQPSWSDFPFLLISTGEQDTAQSARIEEVRRILGNVTVVDRPISVRLLLSTVHSTLRARKRQYEMRDALATQRQTLDALRQAEKMAVSGRLLATITHEINNPLAAITNLVFLADKQSKETEVRQMLGSVQEELKRVADIIQHTLRLSRDAGSRTHTGVETLVESSLALFRHKLHRSAITSERRIRAGLHIYCAPGEIRQALVNLIANAVDAMPQGGRLSLRAKPLTLNGTQGVIIFVADSGFGIPNAIRGRLFEQFFTTKGASGTGVGLWLTQDLLRRNGGRVRFRSREAPRRGTIFSLWIPAMDPSLFLPLDSANGSIRVA